MILFLVIYIHFFTCIWWMIISKSDEPWIPPRNMVMGESFYYILYDSNILQKYTSCLQCTVMLMLGTDMQPRGQFQTMVAGTGIFLGGIINANIFGELAVIFSSIGKAEKQTQNELAMMNTAMINLKLPCDIQQNVRVSFLRNMPSKQSQEEMQNFLQGISPSIRYKVLEHIYKQILK